MLVMIAGLSLGALLPTCLGGSSSGSDANQAASRPAQVDKTAAPQSDANQPTSQPARADKPAADSDQPASVGTGPAQVQTQNKLLGWWRLDEADGNSVADASGNGRAGTRMGNPQWRLEGGRVGGALEFHGDGGRVEIGDESAFDLTETITVAAWIKVNIFSQRWQSIVTKGDSAWWLQRTAEDDTLSFHCTGIQSADPDWPMGVAGRKSVNDSQWHHVVGVYDGATVSLYIDGVLDNSSPASGRIATNNFAVVIGGNSERSGREWNGLIDEVCILACAIDANEVRALYSGKSPSALTCAPAVAARDGGTAPTSQAPRRNALVAWWKLDDNISDSAGASPGTAVGSLTYAPGKSGQALSIDGAACVDCGKQDSLDFGTGDWAVSAWIKTTQSGIEVANRETVFANGADELGGVRYTLAVNEVESGRITLTTDDDAVKAQATGQTTVNDGAWHHVVGTRDGGMLRLYVDGELDGTSNLPGKYDLAGASKQNAYIGAIRDNRDGSLYKYFVGQIDDVCVFACALGDSDAKALYSGTDAMTVADGIRDRAAGQVVAAAAPAPAKKTYGKWLVAAAILVAGGLTAWAYWSRRRWLMSRAAADMARRDLGGSLRHIAHGMPGMTWQIARKEFLLNLMTFKFTIGTAVCIILMAVFMPGLVNDYKERLQNYNGNVAMNEAEFQKVKVYNNLTPTVYRTPTVLSVFSKGIVDRLETSERIDLEDVSGAETGVGEANTLLSVFPTMDVTLILKIVISVLALLMAYDVVSGEREQGTLRLILSNTAPRHQVLLGKLVAGWMTLAVPVTVAFIVALLILLTSNAVNLSGTDWFRIALMYLVSLVFVGSVFNLGLLLSSVSRGSAISLVFALFLWLCMAAILPNASAHIAAELRPIESPEQFAARLKAITDQRDQEIADLTKDIHEGEGSSRSDGTGAFGNGLIVFASKAFMDYLKQIYPITEPRKMQCIDKLLDVKAAYLSGLVRQKQLADTLAGVTPIILCERLMSTLAGTDFSNFGSFKNRVRTYRHEVADYIREKTENFASPIYFTPSKEGDQERFFETFFKPYDKVQDKALKAKLYETAMQKYMQAAKDAPTLDLEDFPKFTYRSQPVAATLQQAIPAAGLLILEGVLFFALSFVAFLRYDVR